MKIRGDTRVQSIELQNFGVGQAVAFSDDDSWIDILVVLDSIKESKVRRGTKTASAHFALHSSSNNSAVDITTHAGCDVLVTYGDSIGDLLSPPEVQADDEYLMLHAESDRFYNALDDIGLGYTGPFRALSGPHQEPRKQQALAKASPRAPGNVGCGHPVCHAGLRLSGRHQTELLKQPLQRLDPSTRLVPQLTVIGRGASADQVHLLATDRGARVHQPSCFDNSHLFLFTDMSFADAFAANYGLVCSLKTIGRLLIRQPTHLA